MGVVNRRTYIVAGLQRSGNHGIINWILSNQADAGTKALLNNVDCFSNPLLTARQNLLQKFSLAINLSDELKELSPKEALAVSYEDRFPDECFHHDNLDLVRKSIGESEKIIKVLIIRDPFNFFASRIISEKKATQPPKLKVWIRGFYFWLAAVLGLDKAFYRTPITRMNAVIEKIRKRLTDNSFARIPLYDRHTRRLLQRVYKEYCRCFIADNDIVCINFSLWSKSEAYRKNLSKELGLVGHINGVKEEAVYSNFDNRIAPNERWKVFEQDLFYREVFHDQELLSLSKKIFQDSWFAETCSDLTKRV